MCDEIFEDIIRGLDKRIKSFEVAKQFVLEELESAYIASVDNYFAKKFFEQSEYSVEEVEGAMSNSFEEVDGLNGPQQFLHLMMMTYFGTPTNDAVKCRIRAVKYIMNE